MKKYFKKFSIMFVMALAIALGSFTSAFADDNYVIGKNNLNNTTENSAKKGDVLKLPEIGWKRYDDSNSNINYSSKMSRTSGSWFVENRSAAYNTTIIDILYATNCQGENVSFNFYGSKLRIIAPYWWSCTPSVNVYIDGKSVGSYSENSSNITNTHQTLIYSIEGLNMSTHSVKIVNLDSSGNHFAIDAIDIDENGYLSQYSEIQQSVSLNKSSMDLTVGDSGQLTATTTPAAVGVTWTSSDTSIATVDSTGKVTAIGAGTAIIKATTTDGSNLSASCIVTVAAKGADPNPNPNPNPNPEATNIVNIAYAKGDNTNNAGGEVSIIFNGLPDTTLSVVKTADVKSVYVGDTFTYTIVVTNTGSKVAKAVVINDSAPNHIDFTVDGITTTQGKVDSNSTSKKVIVNVGDIQPLGTVTIKIPVTVIL